MKEVNTILEMLIESRTQLLEAKARIKEREAEINKDLSDCYIAIAALTPKVEVAAEQMQEQTERLPKVGDELVAIKNVHNDNGDIVIQLGKTYPVDNVMPGAISVMDGELMAKFFFTGDGYAWHWKNYFRFADEQAPEDMSNLHSYLHVNGEPNKPYRIKTRQEMIDGGAVLCSEYKGHKHCVKHPDGMHLFTNEMTVLFGSETETNEPHDIIIDGIPYAIEPWMITENK